MPRRVHHPAPLTPGLIPLDPAEARHLRVVLRLKVDDTVELFDSSGSVAPATIVQCDESAVVVRVVEVNSAPEGSAARLVVASAVPKGDRAEWMIEKLSELGVDTFVPLSTARSVVHPEGKNKRDRWTRIATEAAKQSRRAGVMKIADLQPIDAALRAMPSDCTGWVLSLEDNAAGARAVLEARDTRTDQLFIGPEGGWTQEELDAFPAAKVRPLKLSDTVLRIETAAVVAAGLFTSTQP